MSDDKSKTVAERKRINIHEDYELRFWSKKCGVSPNELRCAVSKVGVFADDTRRQFARRNVIRAARETGGTPLFGVDDD